MKCQKPYVGMPINLEELDQLNGQPYDKEQEKSHCRQQECNSTSNMQPMALAMAYVPWQCWNETYNLDKALEVGTIFPDLDLPFLGCKGGMRK